MNCSRPRRLRVHVCGAVVYETAAWLGPAILRSRRRVHAACLAHASARSCCQPANGYDLHWCMDGLAALLPIFVVHSCRCPLAASTHVRSLGMSTENLNVGGVDGGADAGCSGYHANIGDNSGGGTGGFFVGVGRHEPAATGASSAMNNAWCGRVTMHG